MRKLNKFNITCIIILWIILCFLVITRAEKIGTDTVIYIIMSAGFVFIPIWKYFKNKNKNT